MRERSSKRPIQFISYFFLSAKSTLFSRNQECRVSFLRECLKMGRFVCHLCAVKMPLSFFIVTHRNFKSDDLKWFKIGLKEKNKYTTNHISSLPLAYIYFRLLEK